MLILKLIEIKQVNFGIKDLCLLIVTTISYCSNWIKCSTKM